MLPVLVVLGLTAIWGYTFVPTKDAVAIYPVVAFLGVRFLIATGVLSLIGLPRLRRLPRGGWLVGVAIGLSLAASLGLQTAGLGRTTVSSTGFITGLYVVFTPLLGFLLFRHRTGLLTWVGAAVSVAGLALIAGAPGGQLSGDLLVLASTGAQALQIIFIGRWAIRYDVLALTLVEIVVAAVALLALAAGLGDLAVPRGSVVWSGLLITAIPGTAMALVGQIWVQQRLPAARAAILFTVEVPFAALFGILLHGDSLGTLGWLGGGLIALAILIVEPAARDWAQALVRSASGRRAAPPRRRARSPRRGGGP